MVTSPELAGTEDFESLDEESQSSDFRRHMPEALVQHGHDHHVNGQGQLTGVGFAGRSRDNFGWNIEPDLNATTTVGLGQIRSEQDAYRLLNDRRHSQACHVERKEPETRHSGATAQRGDEKYKSEAERLRSFEDRRWPDDVPVPAAELARAGWFFTGVTDRVRCPWCGGVVYNWTRDDTALGEHRRHFPHCSFVKNKLKETFERPQLRFRPPPRPHHRQSDRWQDWASVAAVMELGFTEAQICDVITTLQTNGISRKFLPALYNNVHVCLNHYMVIA